MSRLTFQSPYGEVFVESGRTVMIPIDVAARIATVADSPRKKLDLNWLGWISLLTHMGDLDPWLCGDRDDADSVEGAVALIKAKLERQSKIQSGRRSFALVRGVSYAAIASRDGEKCATCGRTDNLTVDHVLALAKGGSNDIDNLQLLCRSCNSRKGAR
jgi:hypothetical protein